MPDLAFLSRVAALLAAREGASDLSEDAQRILQQLSSLVSAIEPHTLARRLADDEIFADELRAIILRAYAIPTLAHGLPDPSPIVG